MYSPTFFKENFCENKNSFKNQEQQNPVKDETPTNEKVTYKYEKKDMAFKVENIKHSDKEVYEPKAENKSFSRLVSDRIKKFTEYCIAVANAYFRQEPA